MPDDIKNYLNKLYNDFANPFISRLSDFPEVISGDCMEYYEYDNDLGSGGQGRVYLAHHKQTKERVAIKQIEKIYLSEKINTINVYFVKSHIIFLFLFLCIA